MAKQLLGKEVTAALNERIKGNVAALQEKGVNPTLCIIRVGENPSDISYEKGATKRCETLGVACEKILLPEDVAQEELLTVIDKVKTIISMVYFCSVRFRNIWIRLSSRMHLLLRKTLTV